MPAANPSGHFHVEKRLDVNKIADIQQIRKNTAEIVFTDEREYKGVLFVAVAENRKKDEKSTKRQKSDFKAVVLGQSQEEPGKVVLYRKPLKIFQTSFGIEMKQGAIAVGNVHWCSGLQIKWEPQTTPNTQVETGLFKEKVLQDARVKLAKELFALLDAEDDWSDVDWDGIESKIDSVQRQLNVANSPKDRQKKGGKKPSTPKKNKNLTTKKNVEAEQEEPSGNEDWTSDRHLVTDCKFNIDKSVKLSDEEKARVKFLMKQYRAQEPDDFEQYNHELARLLDKAFKAPFHVKILNNFTMARRVNFKFLGVQTFAVFAAWWENRDVKSDDRSRSRSSKKTVPRNVQMWNARNQIASLFRYRIW